jgi:hypothetical protein
MRGLPLCLVLCLPVACAASSHNSGFPDEDGGDHGSSGGSGSGGGSGGSGGSSGGTLLGEGGANEDAAGNECSGEATNYVYILSAENSLYRFAPNLKQFTLIGPLQCQTQLSPNSMAVDRYANAYVNYTGYPSGSDTPSSGVIYKVSTTDASCGAQPIMTLPDGWYEPGMGYSTAGTSSTVETLYISSTSGGQFGLVDLGKNNVGPIGSFTGSVAGQSCELTGTGDGRLFGYFTTMPVYVAQVDKTSGATPNPVPMTGVQTPQDYAFSFWGGHFYLYSSQGNGSSVTDYDPSTGSIDTNYIANVGFDIVGAGVSTCAPLTMPQ